jgi:chemotaxis protein MotB
MSRRRRHEEHENHERWLVSYADFITLLFAFFVVMYAISSVNEGKYRVLSDSLVAAFRSSTRSLAPIQVGQLVRSPPVRAELPVSVPQPIVIPVQVVEPPRGFREGPDARPGGDGPEPADRQDPSARPADQEAVAERIAAALADLIDRDLIEVRRAENRVEVEIKTSILFPSGSARLVDGAVQVLQQLSEILKGFPNPIQVEGFTDNVPISTEVFPSNWELSAARAASVVHVYTRLGVRPDRMIAVGYGEYRPVVDNSSAEGRSRNRRVVIVIRTGPAPRETVEPTAPALEAVSPAAGDPAGEEAAGGAQDG